MQVQAGPRSAVPIVGVFVGLLLLGFAGVLTVSPSSATNSVGFLSRRLSTFGYITSTRPPSSFDSFDSSSLSASSLEPLKSSESGSLDSSDANILWPKISAAIGGSMGPLSVWLVLQIIFGICYNRLVVKSISGEGGTLDERMENVEGDADRDGFDNKIYECYKSKWVCCQTLCCPMLRVAHTNAVAGIADFWSTVMCWCCCSWLTVGIGPCCLVMWFRLQLKNVMRVKENQCEDFCITMLCPLMSVCQMSSSVDSAMGYEMTDCCHYSRYSYNEQE